MFAKKSPGSPDDFEIVPMNVEAVPMTVNPSADPVKMIKNVHHSRGSIDGADYVTQQKALKDPAFHYDATRTVGDDSQFQKYFEMLDKHKIPLKTVKLKMAIDGLDPKIIDRGEKGKSPNTIRRCYWARDGTLRYQWVPEIRYPKKELSAIIYYDTDTISPGERLYVIDKTWLDMWLMFAVKSTKMPTRIPNIRLINLKTRKAKKRAEFDVHWRPVNHKIWRYLLDRYGGGPAVSIDFDGSEELAGKTDIKKWASTLNFKKACTVHPDGDDGLEPYRDEAVLDDDGIEAKIQELKEDELKQAEEKMREKIAASNRSRGLGKLGKGGFFDAPVIELTQEEKDQSLASGVEPGTVQKTRKNEQAIKMQQNQAAKENPKKLVRTIVFIEGLGMAKVVRFHKVTKSEAISGKNSMHTVEVFGAEGAMRDKMEVLLRRKKPNGYNKGMVFRILPKDEIPEWVREELESEAKKIADGRAAEAAARSAAEERRKPKPEPAPAAEEGEPGEENDKLLPLSSEGGADTPKKRPSIKTALRKSLSLGGGQGASTPSTPSTPADEGDGGAAPVGAAAAEEEQPSATWKLQPSEASATEDDSEAPKLAISRPSWVADAHQTLRRSFSFGSTDRKSGEKRPSGTDGGAAATPGSGAAATPSATEEAEARSTEVDEDQASDLPPESLEGKTVHLDGIGICKVLTFHKVDNMEKLQGKHSMHTIHPKPYMPGTERRLLLRRRKGDKYNTGVRFRIVRDDAD